MKKKVIILLGPPGAGKGTQVRLLKEKFDFEVIGSGKMLRDRKKKGDFTAKKIASYIDAGKRVATPIIFNMWMNRMEKIQKGNKKGFIIDGSPRAVDEAEMLQEALEWYEWAETKKVIYITLKQKEIVNRLTKRRTCKRCGRLIPYLEGFKDLKKCDKCSGEFIKRPDDNIKGINKRMEWFKTSVLPVVSYYKKRKELIEVNGDQSIEEVYKDILKVLR